jgi:hypothetical protein
MKRRKHSSEIADEPIGNRIIERCFYMQAILLVAETIVKLEEWMVGTCVQ